MTQAKSTQSAVACHGKDGGWLMALCCAAPLLVIFTLPLLGVQSQYLTYLAVLACPLSMLLMSIMMNKKERSCHEEGKNH